MFADEFRFADISKMGLQ